MRHRAIAAFILLGLCAIPTSAHATSIGFVNTFQDLTTGGWFAGGIGPGGGVPPVPPSVVATGGPNGAGDAFLKITANTGAGAGSKVVAINSTPQWTGDFIAAGVNTIQMDLKNLGATDLTIRLLFEDPLFGPPADEAVTTAGVFLPAGGNWVHFAFAIAPGNLTAVFGNATTVLHNTTLLRIINAPTAGDAATALGILGVDNVCAGSAPCATAVPEPTTALLTVAGLALVAAARRLRATRS